MSKETISKKIIGIDLGTTNSCVAVDGKVILNDEINTTPSVVCFDEKGEKVESVGEEAKKQIITKPKLVVYEAKRVIGKKFNDPKVQEFCKVAPFKIFENKEKDGDAWIEVGNREYSPIQISAFVLKKMKEFAENFLGGVIVEKA